MNTTRIAIADLPLVVESPVAAADLGLERRFGSFFAPAEAHAAAATIHWHAGDPRQELQGELLYDPGAIWRMYQQDDRFLAALHYPGGDGGTAGQALLQANRTWDDLVLTEQPAEPPWQSLLNLGAGELFFRTRILFAKGLVFHACGLDDNGRGLLFVGHSGVGKSTQARLWSKMHGVTLMNNDRVAVRVMGEGAALYGTPWGGSDDVALNHKAPLSAILLLEQAPENALSRLSMETAVPLLLARSFLPYWDADLMERAFGIMESLLERVPVYLLRCRPEPAVIPLVRAVL